MLRVTMLTSLVGLLALGPAAPAEAQRGSKIYGTWRSTSGNRFQIFSTGDGAFSLTVTWTTGARAVLRGSWVRGLRGTQFQYWHGVHGYTGTFSADDPDRIRVVAGDGAVSWWQRDLGAAAPAPTSAGIYGSWRSTSGNLFSIAPARRGGFRLFLTRPDGARSVLRGSWVAGMAGTQFQYWDATHSYTATFSPTDSSRIRVQASDGQVSWWLRAGAVAAAPAAPVGELGGYPAARRMTRCWVATDPGCRRTKNGVAPMDRAAFVSFLGLVGSAKPHIFPMKDRVRTALGGRYLTSLQLARLLDDFKPHVFVMLEVVKLCAPRVVDPENGLGPVAQKFSPHTMVGSQAAAALSGQRGDP